MPKIYTGLTITESTIIDNALNTPNETNDKLIKIIHRLRKEIDHIKRKFPSRVEIGSPHFFISETEISYQPNSDDDILNISLDGLSLNNPHPPLIGSYYLCTATTQGINGVDIKFEPRIREAPPDGDYLPEELDTWIDETKNTISISAKIINGEPGIIQNYPKPNHEITFHGDSIKIKYITPEISNQSNSEIDDLEDDLEIPF